MLSFQRWLAPASKFALPPTNPRDPTHPICLSTQSLENRPNVPKNAPMQPSSNAGHAPAGNIDGGAAPLNGMYDAPGFDPEGSKAPPIPPPVKFAPFG